MPSPIVTRHRVLRYTRNDFTGYQVLIREWLLFGRIRIWRSEIDREAVPSWAAISRACLGYTDWQSRLFEQYAQLLLTKKPSPARSHQEPQ